MDTITLVDFICYSSLAFMAYHYIKVLKLQKVGDFNSKEYHHYLFSFLFFQAISYLNSVYTLWQLSMYGNFVDYLKNDFLLPGLFLVLILRFDYNLIDEKNMYELYE